MDEIQPGELDRIPELWAGPLASNAYPEMASCEKFHRSSPESLNYPASWRKLTKQWNQALSIDIDPAIP